MHVQSFSINNQFQLLLIRWPMNQSFKKYENWWKLIGIMSNNMVRIPIYYLNSERNVIIRNTFGNLSSDKGTFRI